MVTLVFLLALAVLAFLGKVGFIVYQAMSMDFDFNRPWPTENLSKVNPVEETPATSESTAEHVPGIKRLVLAK